MGTSKENSRNGDTELSERDRSKQRITEYSQQKADNFKYDQYQVDVLATKGKQNIALRAGRQVGKSTVIAALAAEVAIENKNKSIMVISATERQAYLLFSKILLYLDDNYRTYIRKGKDRKSGKMVRPTKTEIHLTTGSIIRCLPTGLDGLGIRGYTTDLLIADEAAFIPEDVWPAVIPQLATTGGKIILLSTPMGDKGYFYECCQDRDFLKFHINAEEVAKYRPEPQRTYMITHQEKQKEVMTELQYAQEYCGHFVSDFRRVFSDTIIKRCCVLKHAKAQPHDIYYLGVDIARMGDDKSSFEIIRKIDKYNLEHVHHEFTEKTLTTQTHDKIIDLNRTWNFRKIGIDAGSGSLGVGILDWLLRDPTVKYKVEPLNNQQRNLDAYGVRRRTLLKEDLYANLVALMEKDKIKLLNDDDVIASLRAIQYEYNLAPGAKSTVKIFASQHKYTDLVEGLIRATWLANQKHLFTSISYL